MQAKMQEAQKKLESSQYQGKAGGDLVRVTINGGGRIDTIKIDESLLKTEEKEMLEDLIIAAYNDAKQKVEQESQSSMSDMMSGLSLPPGFKMPF